MQRPLPHRGKAASPNARLHRRQAPARGPAAVCAHHRSIRNETQRARPLLVGRARVSMGPTALEAGTAGWASGRVTLCPTGVKRAGPALKMLGGCLLFFSYISFLMPCTIFLSAMSILLTTHFSLDSRLPQKKRASDRIKTLPRGNQMGLRTRSSRGLTTRRSGLGEFELAGRGQWDGGLGFGVWASGFGLRGGAACPCGARGAPPPAFASDLLWLYIACSVLLAAASFPRFSFNLLRIDYQRTRACPASRSLPPA